MISQGILFWIFHTHGLLPYLNRHRHRLFAIFSSFLKIMIHKTSWHIVFSPSSKMFVMRIKWLGNEYRFLAFCGNSGGKWLTIEKGFKGLLCWILLLIVIKMSGFNWISPIWQILSNVGFLNLSGSSRKKTLVQRFESQKTKQKHT